ncbi:MAG: HTH-type transcriptional activator Btr [Lentisphaerae bacterium ADurb.Bin242]|nr:MAG: HTH-type transcriptional activator Btr [Lentisphaerae bacterium ADurb.Bin242]
MNPSDSLMEWYKKKPVDVIGSRLCGLPFVLLNAGNTEYVKHIDYIRYDYPFYVFEHIEKGMGTIWINDTLYEVKASDVYILPAHASHKLHPDGLHPWSKTYFVSVGPLVDHLLEAFSLKGKYHFKNCGNTELHRLFREMLEINQLPETEKYEKGAGNTFKIIQILSHFREPSGQRSLEAIKIYYYLDRTLFEKLNLDKMSRELGMSRCKMINLCRAELGSTPYDLHLRKRLELARQLLAQNPNLRINEIALQLNFHDQYHFSRLFKQKEGVSPSSYRNKMRQNPP